MKRVSRYISTILIKDGSALRTRPGTNAEYIQSNNINKNSEWSSVLSTAYMVPNESFNLMMCGDVKLLTLTKDYETDSFFDLEESIITDKLIRINVRQFLIDRVYNINKKNIEFKGFVLADLEF